jgi:hypothetical protein
MLKALYYALVVNLHGTDGGNVVLISLAVPFTFIVALLSH